MYLITYRYRVTSTNGVTGTQVCFFRYPVLTGLLTTIAILFAGYSSLIPRSYRSPFMYYSFCILYFRSHKKVLKEIQNNVKVTMSTSTAVDVNMFQMSTSTVAYTMYCPHLEILTTKTHFHLRHEMRIFWIE